MNPNSLSKHPSSDELAAQEQQTGRLPRAALPRYITALLVVAVSGAGGNILVKYGIDHTKIYTVADVFKNLHLDLGVFLLCVQFSALITAFRWGPLSLTVPMRGASIYILTALLAIYFLNEQIGLMRWAAIVVIIIGITIIGISGGK